MARSRFPAIARTLYARRLSNCTIAFNHLSLSFQTDLCPYKHISQIHCRNHSYRSRRRHNHSGHRHHDQRHKLHRRANSCEQPNSNKNIIVSENSSLFQENSMATKPKAKPKSFKPQKNPSLAFLIPNLNIPTFTPEPRHGLIWRYYHEPRIHDHVAGVFPAPLDALIYATACLGRLRISTIPVGRMCV